MTGFGEARHQDPRWTIQVEVRTVNNRHFKLSARISERTRRSRRRWSTGPRGVKRGTVQVSLRIERPRRPEDYRLNLVALASYRDQLRGVAGRRRPARPVRPRRSSWPCRAWSRRSGRPAVDPHDDWPEVARVVGQALDALEAARAQEGRAMADELHRAGPARSATTWAGSPTAAPWSSRPTRSGSPSGSRPWCGQGVTVEPKDLIREVAILADRCDISEEIVRLRAHLAQYAAIIEEPESSGRKLEFLVQEMGREINTIGSKANDVEISRAVVESRPSWKRFASWSRMWNDARGCDRPGRTGRDAPGRLVVISGPSGSGKSTLVAAAARAPRPAADRLGLGDHPAARGPARCRAATISSSRPSSSSEVRGELLESAVVHGHSTARRPSRSARRWPQGTLRHRW